MIRQYLVASVPAFSAIAWSHTAIGQEYPTRPVRIVVPFLPGAGNDTLGRMTAEFLTPRLGQSDAEQWKSVAKSAKIVLE